MTTTRFARAHAGRQLDAAPLPTIYIKSFDRADSNERLCHPPSEVRRERASRSADEDRYAASVEPAERSDGYRPGEEPLDWRGPCRVYGDPCRCRVCSETLAQWPKYYLQAGVAEECRLERNKLADPPSSPGVVIRARDLPGGVLSLGINAGRGLGAASERRDRQQQDESAAN